MTAPLFMMFQTPPDLTASVAITATGSVSVHDSSSENLSVSIGITASGQVGRRTSASMPLTGAVSAAGTKAPGVPASQQLTVSITAAGAASRSSSATSSLSVAIRASGYKSSGNGPTRWLRVNGSWVKVPDPAVMVGEIRLWSTATAPTGWLLTGPTAVSRTTYSALFAVIGTTFGIGDGSTTFNLPNPTAPSGLYYIIRT